MADGIEIATRKRKDPTDRPQGERRRRAADGATTGGKNLGVRSDAIDTERYAYRWINDDPARIFAKTRNDDWDLVTNDGEAVKEDASDLGNAVSVVVGTTKTGESLRAYLCRKPRAWYEEDQRQKQTELAEQVAQLRRGNDVAGKPQSDYVPSGGIRLEG